LINYAWQVYDFLITEAGFELHFGYQTNFLNKAPVSVNRNAETLGAEP
jgi:hypothetical protein